MNNRKWLERLVNSLFIYDNVPDTIDIDFINHSLNNFGYVTFLRPADGKLRAFHGAISGLDEYSRAVRFESTNPVSKYSGLKRIIGKNCVVMYNTLNRRIPQNNLALLNKYAGLLDNIDLSINAAIYNSRISSIFKVKSDVEAQQVRAMCDQVAMGKPFIVANDDALSAVFGENGGEMVEHLPVKNNYVLDLLLRDRYTIICNFLTELGINNTPFEKKEREIVNEVESNNEMLHISNFEYLKARENALEAVNKMFGANIQVRFNCEEVERMVQDVLQADV